jgi:predicted short-subunit dehydrogenase-like oxidoreductase (DUF2520 family)
MKRFSVIGAGRLGTSLGRALVRRGWELKAIADRDPAAARESARIIGRGTVTADVVRAARQAPVVFITVPDDAVEEVARRLARARPDWSGRTVFHTSGLLASSALAPLRARGARVASLHPVQSFPAKAGGARLFPGIFWGTEGDPEAVRLGKGIVRSLGGRAFSVHAESKPLYHAACSLAANAFVALEAAAAALMAEAGAGQKTAAAVLTPLVQGTLQGVKKLGLEKALTGPVVRGDVGTVRRHLEALASRPLHFELYRVLGLAAVRLLEEAKTPPRRLRALKRLLEDRRLPLPSARRRSRKRAP